MKPRVEYAPSARAGFVLLATMWVIVVVAAVSLTLALTARRVVEGSRNRINERVAYWDAVGCLARANAALSDQLVVSPRTTQAEATPLLHSIAGCAISVEHSAPMLDINALTEAQARTLATAAGLAPPQVDSVVAAITGSRQREFTSDSAIALRSHTFLRRARLLRFLSVDSAPADFATAPREVQVVLAAAGGPSAIANTTTAARPPPDSMSARDWWITASSETGDPPVTVVVRAEIVLFGGSFGVKEYRVE